MTFQERLERLNEMIAEADKIVFFTGAGISTAAGIPDFRSIDGLYSIPGKGGKGPEYMLSHPCLRDHPEDFHNFLATNLDVRGYEPTLAHKRIVELQETKDVKVITQNIDGLHELAGTAKVATIHGSFLHPAYCTDCATEAKGFSIFENNRCSVCGEYMRPDIVLYGEGMRHPDWPTAQMWAARADLMIIVGTSLKVGPANMIPHYFGHFDKIVIINRDETIFEHTAGLVFHEDIQKVFEGIKV